MQIKQRSSPRACFSGCVAGMGLLELKGVSMSLEDVFINLTTQEPQG